VDENGHPLQGMTVRLFWQNYSAETEGHEQNLETDQNGYVVFPARTLRASVMRRVFMTLRESLAIAHASYGPHAHVFTFGRGLEGGAVTDGYVIDWTGKPDQIQSRIVAKAQR
jgi:hypothetical protein